MNTKKYEAYSVSSTSPFFESFVEAAQFDQLRDTVESEFDVEDGLMEYGVPTFYVRLRQDSKQAFLRLIKRFDATEFVPILRKKDERVVLQVIPKPPTKPSRKMVNIGLFFATLGTVFLSGYLLSVNIVDALIFTGALMAILGSHEMGHKLLADKHDVEATYPYFIPGLPPIGTFGAVIRQKSLPPNKDALFDVGFAGPVAGFIVTIFVTLIGVLLSVRVAELPLGATPWPYPKPILFEWLFDFAVTFFPPSGIGDWIVVHPVVFAGWVGMLVTMLNLVPAGMLDGGHAMRSLFGEQTCRILSILATMLLFLSGYYLMAMFTFFLSMQRHPGPLDDVSKLAISRKLAFPALVSIFVLCMSFPIL